MRRTALPQLRDDVLAEELDGRHDLLVRDRLRRHQELQLVDAGGLVDGDAPEATLRIAGHEDATVDQCVRVDLIPEGAGDLP